ncbi:MAG: DUF615 domain-containing protein [Bacillota bacterium]|nr:DUF615 domain-containing protein [Bacillota bacterium]
MAKEKQDTSQVSQASQSPKPQGSEKKKNGLMFGLLAFLTAVAVMAVVIGGAFYIVLHNNVNGLADKYGKSLKNVPVLSWMLPKSAKASTPADDLKNLTESELRSKYTELKNSNDTLTKQLADANKKITDLQKTNDNLSKSVSEIDKTKADYINKAKQLDTLKKQIDQLIAKGDTAGFKSYFDQVDPQDAQKIYAQIVQNQQVDAQTTNFAKIYSAMAPSSAAQILEQMGTSKMDLVVKILQNMSKNATSQVLAAMTPSFAATVSDKLSKAMISQKTAALN